MSMIIGNQNFSEDIFKIFESQELSQRRSQRIIEKKLNISEVEIDKPLEHSSIDLPEVVLNSSTPDFTHLIESNDTVWQTTLAPTFDLPLDLSKTNDEEQSIKKVALINSEKEFATTKPDQENPINELPMVLHKTKPMSHKTNEKTDVVTIIDLPETQQSQKTRKYTKRNSAAGTYYAKRQKLETRDVPSAESVEDATTVEPNIYQPSSSTSKPSETADLNEGNLSNCNKSKKNEICEKTIELINLADTQEIKNNNGTQRNDNIALNESQTSSTKLNKAVKSKPSLISTKNSQRRPSRGRSRTKIQRNKNNTAPISNYVEPKVMRYYYNSCPNDSSNIGTHLISRAERTASLYRSLLPPVYPPHFKNQIVLSPPPVSSGIELHGNSEATKFDLLNQQTKLNLNGQQASLMASQTNYIQANPITPQSNLNNHQKPAMPPQASSMDAQSDINALQSNSMIPQPNINAQQGSLTEPQSNFLGHQTNFMAPQSDLNAQQLTVTTPTTKLFVPHQNWSTLTENHTTPQQNLLPPVGDPVPATYSKRLQQFPKTSITNYSPISLLTPDNSEIIAVESSQEIGIALSPETNSPLSLRNFFEIDEMNDIFDAEQVMFELNELHVEALAIILNISSDELFEKLEDIVQLDAISLQTLVAIAQNKM